MLISKDRKNMDVVIKEKEARSILSKSGISGTDYCINPYTGCSHGCKYCYATFMKRFTGHGETWGSFVDVKINAPAILQRQMKKAPRGNIMISSVTDPYQPVENRYKLTRQCLEVILAYQFPVSILTKSSLVLRDLDLIKRFKEMEVGITITTDDDKIREIFEPNAPSIETRIHALKELSENGVETYAFIGPLLPLNPEALAEKIGPYIQSVLIDRMNYASKTQKIYEFRKLKQWLEYDFVDEIIQRLEIRFAGKEVSTC
jgi:DNA repair photolyase